MHYAARMTSDTEALARAIGVRVKQQRNARRWTLDRLAGAAGVSRRMLVNVEQGAVNPSVGTLLRLSEALGVGLPELVEPPAPRSVKVTRNGEGPQLWSGEHGGRGILVANAPRPDIMELWDWTLMPGEAHESDAHTPGTRELLQVLEGTVVVECDGHASTLREGDAVAFPGDAAHAYRNTSTVPARFSLAVFEPPARPEA